MRLTENLILMRNMEKYNLLSEEKKKKYDYINYMDYMELRPRVIKRKRKYPEKGDIFVISPFDGVYFFGIVLNNYIKHSDCYNALSVLIFKDYTTDINNVEYTPDFDNAFFGPHIVTTLYWTNGYFYTVGKSEIPDNLDYGFMDSRNIWHNNFTKLTEEFEFVNEFGKPIDHIPKNFGIYGLTTDIGVTMTIRMELLFDDSILG